MSKTVVHDHLILNGEAVPEFSLLRHRSYERPIIFLSFRVARAHHTLRNNEFTWKRAILIKICQYDDLEIFELAYFSWDHVQNDLSVIKFFDKF